MTHILCKWIGERRFVPKYGTFEKGDKIYLPNNIAKEFQQKKLIQILTKKKSKEK